MNLRLTSDTRQNLLTYAVLILLAALGIVYGEAIASPHSHLRVWPWANLLLMLAGVPFLFLQHRAGLPGFWSTEVTHQQRIVTPLFIGVVFGILDVLVIKVIQHPEPYTDLPPFLQPFPYSLFLYSSGAFEIEVFYRLIPITFILVLGTFWADNRYSAVLFWVAAVLTSVREPLEQLPSGGWALIAYSLGTGFGMNFLQALWFKRAGFMAALFIRLGHYLIWHILLGLYVEIVELGRF